MNTTPAARPTHEATLTTRRHRGGVLLAALVLMGVTACDEGVTGPLEPEQPEVPEAPAPGAVTVVTATSGFMKDDGYEVLVDGASAGAIGPDDEMTLSELEPATYEITLGDVADNCSVEAVWVEVPAGETVTASLDVVCAPADPDSYTIRASRARPNLDDGTIVECPFGICSTSEGWDLYVHDSSQSDPRSVVRQNQTQGVEIAHLPGMTLATLTEEDVAGATFTTELVPDPFDAERVILIRTDLGAVYALGNPAEEMVNQSLTLTFDAVLVSSP